MLRFVATATLTAFSCAAAGDVRLVDALKRRDVKQFHALMAGKADVNAAMPDGATPLSWAVFLNLDEPAMKLIDAGANVNAAGEYGETPLLLALANGNATLAARLLKAGADAKATRWNGETALMIAAGTGNVDCVKLMLDQGVDVNVAEPNKGQNALMWAAAEGHDKVVDLLIQKGANVKIASKGGVTPLVFSASRNDAKSVAFLLAAGSDPNLALPDGTKVLSVTAAANSTEAAALLLDKGADPNIADRSGNTPLHVASQNGTLEMVKKLIAKGAKIDARTSASKPGGAPAAFVRGAVGGQQTALLLAAKANKVDVMRALIEAGADPKLKAQDGTTLLMSASSSSRVEAARFAYQYDKDVTATDEQGSTAMHVSMGGGRGGATQDDMTDLVQYLAEIGVPLDELDKRGRSAAKVGDGSPFDKPIQRITEIILSRGGKPNYIPKEFVMPARLHTATPIAASTAQ